MMEDFSSNIISEHTMFEIISLASNTINRLYQRYRSKDLSPAFYTDTLLLIAESYPLLDSKEKLEEFGYSLCCEIKNELEKYGVRTMPPGMLGGFGGICCSVNSFSQNTGLLSRFSLSLNNELTNQAMIYLDSIKSKNGLAMRDYDLVSGLSGVLYYLLDFQKESDEVKKLVYYLVCLANKKSELYEKSIGYHISSQYQVREDEQRAFPEGHLNFGLAHGMIGPLAVMSKAMALGVVVDELKQAIRSLLSVYEEFAAIHEGIVVWPSQLSMADYFRREQRQDIRPAISSWCYGNLGIARGLHKVAIFLGDKQQQNIYEQILLNIIDRPAKEYNLFEDILCHGYSSVLAVQMATYYSTRNADFLNTLQHNLNIIQEHMDLTSEQKFCTFNKLLDQDPSLLMGAGGIMLSLLSTIRQNMTFQKLLFID